MQRFVLVVAFIFAASTTSARAGTFRIGCWNIEKLSTKSKRGFPELKGNKQLDPRTDTQLKEVAKYIKNEIKMDGLIVMEVDDDATTDPLKPRSVQLDKVVQELGSNWKYFLGRTGGNLRIGFLFNTNRIVVKKIVNVSAAEFKVADEDVYDRDPLLVHIALKENGVEKNDLFLVGLHLKSQTKFIHNHMAAVAKLLGDLRSKAVRSDLGLPAPSKEKDAIIVGDMNDDALTRSKFKFMFDYLKGSGYDHLGPDNSSYPGTRISGKRLDHIFVRKSNHNGVKADTFKVHSVPQSQKKKYREDLSDHFPVTVDVESHNDDD